MMDFILTGAHGDVGAQCVTAFEGNGFSWIPYDGECHDNARCLFHLAAKHPSHSMKALMYSNVTYWQKVLDVATERCDIILFCSSTSVYGANRAGIISESYSGFPSDSYGMTKFLGERLLNESTNKGLSVRCPAILESRNSHNFMSALFDKLWAHKAVSLFNADKPFNVFLPAESLAKFVMNVIRSNKKPCDTVNIAANADLSLAQIVEIMRTEIASKSEIKCSAETGPWHTIDTNLAKQEFDFEPGDTESLLKRWTNVRKQHFQEHQRCD